MMAKNRKAFCGKVKKFGELRRVNLSTIFISFSLFLWGILGSGCGPVTSLSNIVEAKTSIEALDSVRGWYWTCYEYYAALQYMKKSREERGYADFQASADFAAKADSLAINGRKVALMRNLRKDFPPVTCDKPKKMAKKYRKKFEEELKKQLKKR